MKSNYFNSLLKYNLIENDLIDIENLSKKIKKKLNWARNQAINLDSPKMKDLNFIFLIIKNIIEIKKIK